MSQPQEPRRPEPPTTTPTGGSGARPWFWLLPALTFVVGLALGAVVMAANDDPDTDDSAGAGARPTATVTATTAPTAAGTPSGRTITVPASCEEGLERARTALSTVDQAVEAVRDLNTARLQELLDQLQQARQEVDRLADQCRREAPERN